LTGRDRSGEGHVEIQRILTFALKAERFAVGALNFADLEIFVQLDTNVLRNFDGPELNFGDGVNPMRDGVDIRGDVVFIGEERKRVRCGRLSGGPGGSGGEARHQQ
jgi:hypothetical protein